MKYFSTLPSIPQSDFNGNYLTATNIISRAYLLSNIKDNLNIYYDYDLKEFDSPENIAYKLYNDSYRFWLVFYANGIFNSNSDWPLSERNFYLYITDKYASEANTANLDSVSYAQSTIHHYEKSITTYNSVDMVKTTTTFTIDEDTYNGITDSTLSNTFPDGTTVVQETTKRSVSIYDYESSLNENKRKIKLIKPNYANGMENQLTALMSR